MHKRSLFFAAFILLSLFLSSCSGLVDGIMGENEDEDEGSSFSRMLTLTIDNYTDVIDTSNSSPRLARKVARTISAESYKNTEAGLKFWVYGSSTDGEELNPTNVDFTKGSTDYSGLISLDKISASDWYLTLVVVTEDITPISIDDVFNEAVLIGRANVDLRSGTSVTFSLTTEGLVKEAAVKLTVKPKANWFTTSSNPDSTWSVKAAIYDRVTGAIEKDNEASPGSTEKVLYTSGTDTFTAPPAAANYEIPSMKPGTYLFKVSFSNKDTGKTYVWSDLIRILPGKTLEQDVEVPNIIGLPPTAPTHFFAQYAAKVESDAAVSGTAKYAETPSSDFYVVDFTWTAGDSKNEQYFELDIAEFSDTFDESAASVTYPATDADWDTLVGDSTIKVSTYNAATFFETSHESKWFDSHVTTGSGANEYALGSSLYSGSQHAEFILELGKRYYARIRAVNDAGDSDYAYVNLSGVTASDDRSEKYLTFDSSTINLYRVCYSLNGGVYYGEGKDTADGKEVTEDILEYYSRNTTSGAPIKDISKGGYDEHTTNKCKTADETVIKGDTALTQWLDRSTRKAFVDTTIEDATGVKSMTKYSGYKNLDLSATLINAIYEILNPAEYEFGDDWVTISNTPKKPDNSDDTANATSDVPVEKDGNVDAKAGKVKISVTLPAAAAGASGATWVYDYLDFQIRKNDGKEYHFERKESQPRGTATESTEAKLGAGIYDVTIIGRYGSTVNSFKFLLTVTNN